MVDEDRPLSITEQKFVENALDVVKLRFVRREQDFSNDEIEKYNVEFAHQHFGDSETIFGYQNLSITINYSATSLYIYPEFKYSRTSKEGGSSIAPDDLYGLLQKQLPTGNFFIMVDSKKEFMNKLAEQKNFVPFGKKVATFSGGSQLSEGPTAKRAKVEKSFELYKVMANTPEFDVFLAQLQTVALWYIDAAEYTDNRDERWMHYVLYEIYYETNESGELCKRYAVAGYASLFRFFHYPEQSRIRIAHFLVFPNHRNTGIGAKFYDAMNRDIRTMTTLYDITVEDAADSMIYVRDYVDCLDCQTLPEFSVSELQKGFSIQMQQKALDEFKIHSKQARRVYEILRYISTNKEDKEELRKYRIDIKRRLEKPMKRRNKDWNKLKRALDEDTINQLAAAEGNPEIKMALLGSLFEDTIKGYEVVADRLKNYPTI